MISDCLVISDQYLISGNLCDFRSPYTFRTHVVSDFWVSTFRFLGKKRSEIGDQPI